MDQILTETASLEAALLAAFAEMERIGMAVAADGWIQDESNLMMAKEKSEPHANYPGYISCLIIRLTPPEHLP